MLAIDPGNISSAWCEYDFANGEAKFGKVNNQELRYMIRNGRFDHCETVVIEMVACYGMAVGKEVFETCVWIGRFEEIIFAQPNMLPTLMYRQSVKIHLCNSVKAKDSNIIQVVADRYGGIKNCKGTKKNPGPLYGIAADMWQALALAITYAETKQLPPF